LTEYLNHRETAHRFDLEPNGGARAQNGLHHPLVRMSNTVIQGGSHRDLDELIEDIQFGIYACGSRGGQVDTGRGSFQFAAQEAWLIENGSLKWDDSSNIERCRRINQRCSPRCAWFLW
jgi:TldD protein